MLVDNMYPPTILPAVKMAKSAGLTVVSDIERDMPTLPEIRRYIDHYICSAEFALPHTGCDCPAEACRRMEQVGHHQSVVVTAGADGVYWQTREDDEVRHLSAHSVKAADTTGCGDVFHAAFCYGLLQEWPIEKIIPFANAAAGVKATRTGGFTAVPTMDEIQRVLGAS